MASRTQSVPRPRTSPAAARRHELPPRDAYHGVVIGLALALPFWIVVVLTARIF
jgi:hypothetical protein